MNEDVKQMRSAFLESLETARRCERSGVGWPDWVETELDALIAAVEREALERAARLAEEPKYGPTGCWVSEAIRALIESKEG